MYLICIYGVLGRSLRYTHESHIKHIFKPLQEHNISFDVCIINNDIGNNMVDGENINNQDYKIIQNPLDVQILHQDDIDQDIKMKDLQNQWKFFPAYKDKPCT